MAIRDAVEMGTDAKFQHKEFSTATVNTQNWIPLLDYALKNEISLSTLRRHIKANKVEYRIENGRYLLLDENQNTFADSELRADLQRANEEIAELKMLIALYEEKITRLT